LAGNCVQWQLFASCFLTNHMQHLLAWLVGVACACGAEGVHMLMMTGAPLHLRDAEFNA